MSDKIFTCTDINDNGVTITYKGILSAYDQEQVNAPQMSHLNYDFNTGKTEFTGNFGAFSIALQNATLETVVKSWTLDIPPTPDNIKKALSSTTFTQLMKELDTVVKEGNLDDTKKKSSPES
jgi:hypothetical protein